MLEEILAYNKQFVKNKGYESYITNKYPDKKIAILSCMDTRLTALLPAALGIKNGDVKMIKTRDYGTEKFENLHTYCCRNGFGSRTLRDGLLLAGISQFGDLF